MSRVPEQTRAAFAPVLRVIADHAAKMGQVEGLVHVRPGFRRTAGAEPAVVLAFVPPAGADAHELARRLEADWNVPVVAVDADVEDQLRFAAGEPIDRPSQLARLLADDGGVDFRPPVVGDYEPPARRPSLEPVEDFMTVTVAASPDAGWPTLRAFLGEPVDERMTVGIYQFTAPHVYRALRGAMLADDDATLTMTVHPHAEKIREGGGTKGNDIYGPTLLRRLERALGRRFDHARASTGADGTFGTSYHIKVAVADGKRMWLSSGNWQSSNLPPFDPIRRPRDLPSRFATRYNRDYHVVVEHEGLARTFERYLTHDFETAKERSQPFFGLDTSLFVPDGDEAELDFAKPVYFPPLTVSRQLRVTPVLSPDNYADVTLELIRSAEQRIWFQNQYISLNTERDLPQFRALVDALLAKQNDGVEVRILCRDLMGEEKLDMLLALGFERDNIRFMRATHTKTILVDGERALVGSHNWSNEGAVTNRDASLLFDDAEITAYYEKIYQHDWDRRGTASPRKKKPRVAHFGVPEGAAGATVGIEDELGDLEDWDGLRMPPGASEPEPMERADEPASAGKATELTLVVRVPLSIRVDTGAIEARIEAAGAAAATSVTVEPRPIDLPAPRPPRSPAPVAPRPAPAPPSPAPLPASLDLVLNGIHGDTGQYLTPPLSFEEAAALARTDATRDVPWELRAAAKRSNADLTQFGIPVGVDPDDLGQAGWGVVFPEALAAADRERIEEHLAPLLNERRKQAGKRFHSLSYRAGEDVRTWLHRHGAQPGSVHPASVPLHLLLVGGPELIPWEFQYLLDLEYSVGRLAFDDLADYRRYAESAADYESQRTSRTSLCVFAPRHAGDRATELSADALATPLIDGHSSTPPFSHFTHELSTGAKATHAELARLLSSTGPRPAILFTASHGIGLPADHPHQRERQGALLTQDWAGLGHIAADHYFAASDVADDADVYGMVAFLFGCYTAGCPARDTFPTTLQGPAIAIAPRPFVARLPQRLLAHPNGGALAVIGHVDRAWGYSIKPRNARDAHIQAFRQTLARILAHGRIGDAPVDFSGRAAFLSSALLEQFRPGRPEPDAYDLVRDWIERNDAQTYVLLGDPAARLLA